MAISHDSASARVAVVKEILSQRKEELTYPRDYMQSIAKYDRLDVLNIFIEEEIFANYLGPKGSFDDCMDTLYAMLNSMAVKTFPRILELCPEEYFTDDLIDHLLYNTCQNGSQARCLQWKISQQLLDHVRVLRNNDLSSLTCERLAVSIAECIQHDEFLMVDCILSFTGPLKFGQLPLHEDDGGELVCQGPLSSEMLSVLIKHGLDVNQTTGEMTSLVRALQYVKCLHGWLGVVGVVKDTVPMIQDINQQHPDDDDNTALMHWLSLPEFRLPPVTVGESLFLEITELLLDHGASLTSRDKDGDAPLHIATLNCYPSVVQLFINHGADVHATNNEGETALHLATSRTCVAPGVDWADYPQQRRIAIEKITILVDSGATPDSVSDIGMIALRPFSEAWQCHDSLKKMVEIYTSSAQKRDKKIKEDLEFLLGYGLDIDEHGDEGENLLDVCLNVDWLFRYLLSKGAKINATNQNGKTVLDRAEDVSIRDWLIRHGALPGSQLEKAVGN
ncbi:unnamed protein product [Clonostachys chloroleuca]|uniref:Uncharacterized protein n=1 Tax=Clonostachys chloroleuca TaxID=1926264 RepID=A0AA35Q967_9HYPO|nr:unnamed protein product [Clonostachys chloroleuca]